MAGRGRVETLPSKETSCLELDSTHGTKGARDLCAQCEKGTGLLSESNGLLLNMPPLGEYKPKAPVAVAEAVEAAAALEVAMAATEQCQARKQWQRRLWQI